MKLLIAATIAAVLYLGGASLAPSSAGACGVGKNQAHQAIADQRAPGASEIGSGLRRNPSRGFPPPGHGGWLSTCSNGFLKKNS